MDSGNFVYNKAYCLRAMNRLISRNITPETKWNRMHLHSSNEGLTDDNFN